MATDRDRWDEKYAGRLGRERKAPDPFVLAALRRIGAPLGGRALDLAAGTGRHAVVLAQAGWRTHAWDVSPVGLTELEIRAREADVAVTATPVDVLVDGFPPAEPFDLVCVVDFHDAGLWEELHTLVAPGGHAIARTFTLDWPGAKPPARFRLQPGSLAAGLVGLETVLYEEEGGRAGVLARKAS